MLIEGAGVVAHRPTPVPFFIPDRYEKVVPHGTVCTASGSLHPQPA